MAQKCKKVWNWGSFEILGFLNPIRPTRGCHVAPHLIPRSIFLPSFTNQINSHSLSPIQPFPHHLKTSSHLRLRHILFHSSQPPVAFQGIFFGAIKSSFSKTLVPFDSDSHQLHERTFFARRIVSNRKWVIIPIVASTTFSS